MLELVKYLTTTVVAGPPANVDPVAHQAGLDALHEDITYLEGYATAVFVGMQLDIDIIAYEEFDSTLRLEVDQDEHLPEDDRPVVYLRGGVPAIHEFADQIRRFRARH